MNHLKENHIKKMSKAETQQESAFSEKQYGSKNIVPGRKGKEAFKTNQHPGGLQRGRPRPPL